MQTWRGSRAADGPRLALWKRGGPAVHLGPYAILGSRGGTYVKENRLGVAGETHLPGVRRRLGVPEPASDDPSRNECGSRLPIPRDAVQEHRAAPRCSILSEVATLLVCMGSSCV